MSMGMGGSCRKVFENDTEVIYEYLSYNLNEPECRNEKRIADGFIAIEKSGLPEVSIRKKFKRLPNGKKIVGNKKILREFNTGKLISEEKIHIENSDNTWKKVDGYDIIAIQLSGKLIYRYQLDGNFPETVSYDI